MGSAPLAVAPALVREVSPEDALQRLLHRTGRHLTETALRTEQRYREARMGLAGRRLSAGVVSGLSSGLADPASVPVELQLAPGRGIAATGQDVVVHRPTRVPITQVPVHGTVADDGTLPTGLGVLVLQPVAVERRRVAGGADAEAAFRDPCPIDPEALAFERFERMDGARMVFVPWPAGWPVPPAGARARNLAAYEIFRRERDGGPSALPWNAVGVPVALAALSDDQRVLFLDRHAVVRQGGVPPAPRLDLGAGTPSLWQAQLRTEVDHVRELQLGGWDATGAAQHMRFLPPTGLLPREAWARGDFFPAGYRQAMAPVPLEQLELALDGSAALAPFDLDADDSVKWLIPVPQAVFDPELLEQPAIDPMFGQVRDRLAGLVSGERGRRDGLRDMARVVVGALLPEAIPTFDADADALDGEDSFPPPETPPAESQPWRDRALEIAQKLFAALPSGVLDGAERTALDPAQLSAPSGGYVGLRSFVGDLGTRLSDADDVVDLGFTRLQAEIYRLRQIMLDNEEATRLATSPVLAGISRGDSGYARNVAIQAYFAQSRKGIRAVAMGGAGGGSPALVAAPSTRSMLLGTVSSLPIAEAPSTGLASLVVAEPTPTMRLAALGVSGIQALPAGRVGQLTSVAADIRGAAVDDLVLRDVGSRRRGIALATSIPGEFRDFRTLTIADRLKTSAATEAKSSALRTKADTVRQVRGLGLHLGGLEAPVAAPYVVLVDGAAWAAQRDALPPNSVQARALYIRRSTVIEGPASPSADEPQLVSVNAGPLTPEELTEIRQAAPNAASSQITELRGALDALLAARKRGNRLPLDDPDLEGLILAGAFDPDPPDGDESAFFAAAVNALESAVGILRVIEGRIEALKSVLERARDALAAARDNAEGWREELSGADRDLAEARHDVRVADSLIAEETDRLEVLAEHRQQVIREHVKFVAYVRPRTASTHADTAPPEHALVGRFEDPVPACRAEDADPPEALDDLLDAFRDVPLAWLPYARPLVLKLDRPALLDRVYIGLVARSRARLSVLQARPAPADTLLNAGVPALVTAGKLAGAHRRTILEMQRARIRFDPVAGALSSWRERQRRAQAELTLADLIESGARRALARRAEQELEDIESVAVCLYQRFGRLPAAIRLLWTRELSAFDAAQDLRRLAKLPGWNALPFAQRRELDRLVRWLFGRVDRDEPQALALMSDVVRVCLLLASHAPVADIVDGRVEEPQTGRAGGVVDLVIDRGRPRIGMRVDVYQDLKVALQGVVEDLSDGRARIKVLRATGGTVRIDRGAKARLFARTGRAAVRG